MGYFQMVIAMLGERISCAMFTDYLGLLCDRASVNGEEVKAIKESKTLFGSKNFECF